MIANRPAGAVTGLILFAVLATLTQVAVAALYARSVTRLKSGLSIDERELRVLARPLTISVGQAISRTAIEDHLQRIGYLRGCGDQPGCYAAGATLNAVAINMIAFAVFRSPEQFTGLIFAIFVIVIAAAEAGLALGLVMYLYRQRRTINVDEVDMLKW